MALSRRDLLASALAAPAFRAAAAAPDGAWVSLFDGKSLDGWQANENASSWKAVNGELVGDGPRSHLFYNGPVRGADFKNFEWTAEWMTRPGANSGIYFHTQFQPKGWPFKGFEVQLNNTHEGEGTYRERKKTGSLYGVRNIYKSFWRDDQWNKIAIRVRGKQVQIDVNGTLLVDYVEPATAYRGDESMDRTLGHGTFALQCHDPKSKVAFRNIRVRPLADDAKPTTTDDPVVDQVYQDVIRFGAQNIPVVDYHVHLKMGFTLDEALAMSRRLGIQYGLAVNCGVLFPIKNDAGVREFYNSVKDAPVFTAVQGEGREWHTLCSKETFALFDYCFTDAMTFPDSRGNRMRLWIKEDVGNIEDPQKFMDIYVGKILGVMNDEPVDIYANPTFLPDVIAARYDELWTAERMSKVIEAAKRNDVAIEINNRYRIPNVAFLKMAKQAGVKFSFGTNNTDRNVGRNEYGFQMVRECGLRWQDIFVPKPEGAKAIDRKKRA